MSITKIAAVINGLVENQSLASNTLAASAITASSTIMATGAISASNFSGSSSGTNTGDQTITLSGDVSGSGTGAIVTTIAAGAVTLAKMANLAANSIIGNNTASPATPIALTEVEVTAMLNVFSSSLQGVVPASGGGTSNFLRADGTWASPGGLPAPLEALGSYSGNNTGVGTFLGNDSDLDQINQTIILGSSDTAVNGNFTSSVFLAAGDLTGSGPTGGVQPGFVRISGGGVVHGSTAAGGTLIFGGNSDSGPAGPVELQGGSSNSNQGGNVVLVAGTGSTVGLIQFQNGSEGTAGYVWTSTDTSGSGTWMAPSSGSAITSLTSDVSATGPGAAAATVNSVGGSSAANIHSAELAANAATSVNTASTIVKRDSSGNFSAGTITASLTGHASLDLALTGGTMSGNIAMSGNKITGLASGTVSGDALQYGQIGAVNGIAPLDGSGKVPYANLPSALMTYKGAWDPTDVVNTLTSLDPSPLNGDVYRASAAGVAVSGNGAVTGVTFAIGDFAIYNGSAWQHSPAADGVSSVNGAAGAVTLSVNSSNGLAGTYSGTALTLSTTVTGLLKGNGTAISAASAGTDYVVPSGSITGSSSGTQFSATANSALTAQTSYIVRGVLNGETLGSVEVANSTAATTNLEFWGIGMVSGGAGLSPGDPVQVVTSGLFNLGSSDTPFAGSDLGLAVWLTTDGGFSTTAPSASGTASYKIGIVASTTSILINAPQLTGIN